ncbi:hypothetical protein PQC07_gp053 [Aeromonas phage D3]|uniref:Uncharacterized protein n=3 Tax=Ludhianavirus TaxID=3044751 RepID=A0A514A1I8_9CAUD|nr:hypothetical protein PQC06_gp136 [Aeromonas phage LAh10]YP_010668703.1 hypothetical protein PQC07_gp053 [Aeromonas phage D3]YP_010668970.1 hypothetical protein PQC08_gp053 [Aeromonas phage D6]QEP52258.1 hypothetical protein D9_0051 [Aeromonas phage D9]QDH47106.1 hypothetical protein LAh10_136 [Aeromonas phage LAh10]QDJ96952.1 hypothetical protein D3_0222 [Aeromonas phage D3]QDJ97381.1 hypothetical protein D6_0222 [Aeromonas phage D6]
MSIANIAGQEALTLSEKVSSFFSELSLGIDKFNARNFNKSVHVIKDGGLFNTLRHKNNYFDIAYKHIQSPVLFNPAKCSFQEYVELCLQAIGAMQIATTGCESVYRGLKLAAAKGQVPVAMFNHDTMTLIFDLKAKTDLVFTVGNPSTRPVSELYPNWTIGKDIFDNFNRVAGKLNARDAEMLAKSADEVIRMADLLKRKILEQEISLSEPQQEILNESLNTLAQAVQYVGFITEQLSNLTAIMTNHVIQLPKLN